MDFIVDMIEWAFANPDTAILILGVVLSFVIVTGFNQIGKPKVNRKRD